MMTLKHNTVNNI